MTTGTALYGINKDARLFVMVVTLLACGCPVGEVQANETAEAVYEYLLDTIGLGEAPTQREIGDACYLSRGEVRRALIWR